MPIPPKKLAAFANKKDKPAIPPRGDDGGGGKKKGNPFGGKGGGGRQEEEHDDEEEHDHVDAEAIGERVQNGHGDKRLMKMSKGITEETNPPESITDEDIWDKAKDAVEPHWDEYDEPYAVVMHVYDEMGGGFSGEGEGGGGGGSHDDDRAEAEDRYDEHANPEI